MKYIVSLNGDIVLSDKRRLEEISLGAKNIAVDGGLDFFVERGIRVHYLIGDMDSVADDLIKLGDAYDNIKRYPTKKDYTDFELAMEFVLDEISNNYVEEDNEIIVINYKGDDSAHFLGNIFLVVKYLRNMFNRERKIKLKIRFIDDREEIEYLGLGSYSYLLDSAKKYKYHSFIPLEDVKFQLAGFLYSGSYEFKFGDTTSLRNEMLANNVSINILKGSLLYIKSV